MLSTLPVNPQYVVDANGQKIAVLIDIQTYKKMIEVLEDIDDVKAYDDRINIVQDEIKSGSYLTLDEYISDRNLEKLNIRLSFLIQ